MRRAPGFGANQNLSHFDGSLVFQRKDLAAGDHICRAECLLRSLIDMGACLVERVLSGGMD